MKDDYRDGRSNAITEIHNYIEMELEKISVLRTEIPHDTRDIKLSHKRATLGGAVSALCRVRALLNKKVTRMAKKQKS